MRWNWFSSQYKKALNRIGLSDSIEVLTPSLFDLNKEGCFSLNLNYESSNGDCRYLPRLDSVVLTDEMLGPRTPVIANDTGLSYAPTTNHYELSLLEKLMVKIPIKNIEM